MMEWLKRVKTMADAEMTKLLVHLEQTEADHADIRMLKDLLKIEKLTHELMAMVK